MNTEKVRVSVERIKSLLIMLENDLQSQQGDNVASNVVEVAVSILNEVLEELTTVIICFVRG